MEIKISHGNINYPIINLNNSYTGQAFQRSDGLLYYIHNENAIVFATGSVISLPKMSAAGPFREVSVKCINVTLE